MPFDFSNINSGWNPNGNWLDQTNDRLASWSVNLTRDQIGAWDQVANEGIYGDEGINYVMRGRGQEESLRRQNLQKYLRRKYGRRLGARAGGAAEVTFANEVLAPQFAEDQAMRQKLRRENVMSKMDALHSKDAYAQMVTQILGKYNPNKYTAGALDYVKAGANLAAGVAAFF